MEILDLLKATEQAALATKPWISKGDKLSADQAATDAMRHWLNQANFNGVVKISEGIKDNSHMLHFNEVVGKGGKKYDLACDSVDGTSQVAKGGWNAISMLAVGEENSMFSTDDFYMNKLAVGPKLKHLGLSLEMELEEIVEKIAKTKTDQPVYIAILDRPRHQTLIDKLNRPGIQFVLLDDCDIIGAIRACFDDVDIAYGVGGSPEAVLTACAVKCLGGDFQAQVEGQPIQKLDYLIKGECTFIATGITNGDILDGVGYMPCEELTFIQDCSNSTHSVIMTSHGIRWIRNVNP